MTYLNQAYLYVAVAEIIILIISYIYIAIKAQNT